MTPSWSKQTTTGIELSIYCQPGAKVSKIVGTHDGHLKVSLQAPATENKANEALLQWLSKQLRIPQRQIHLLSGQASKVKRIELWAPISMEHVVQSLKP
jgi:uncharacterized protein (TIGR00251 family)